MPTYTITAPDGRTFTVEAPEGATREEALARVQAQYQPQTEDDWKPDPRLGPLGWAGGLAKNIGSNLPEAGAQMVEGVENLASGQTFKDLGNLAKAFGASGARGLARLKGGPGNAPTEAEQPLTDLIEWAGSITPKDVAKFAYTRPVEAGIAAGGLSRGRLDPATIAARSARRGASKGSTGLYKHAAGIEPSTLARGDDLAKRATREGHTVSRGGLQNTIDLRETLNDQLTEIVAEHPFKTPKHVVTRGLDDLAKSMEGGPFGNKEFAQVKQLKADFLKEFGDQRMISTEQLQKWKTKSYQKAYEREGSLDIEEAKGPVTQAIRDSAREARGELEARVPGYADVNQRWQTAAQIKPYIANRIDRMTGSEVGLPTKVLNKTINNPKWQSNVAIFMRKLADGPQNEAIRWLEQNMNTPEIRAALYVAGVTGEEE
jgi:hypothetical protein